MSALRCHPAPALTYGRGNMLQFHSLKRSLIFTIRITLTDPYSCIDRLWKETRCRMACLRAPRVPIMPPTCYRATPTKPRESSYILHTVDTYTDLLASSCSCSTGTARNHFFRCMPICNISFGYYYLPTPTAAHHGTHIIAVLHQHNIM